ncbi:MULTISPECIES: PAS domain-containing sensor histidine kinase [Rhizobium/Agrobacterium group]|jgi:signal transduction histidine kinase|uniref:PAS domain-containing sensor histidine kinase n=1 Tax=Rhizobium/Agrobacterium group TaxID=227290 RepID=UPI00071294E6|nr:MULTISPECIES: ATP-binding protein [Rhizobium/Agrobacterium group]KQY36917.1 histidine kinase [Rhizobium sp. Root491]MDP9759131.1 signal transduction histidine kinase [Agrobacterium tumefaciens]MDQ1223561.1 signal transduction histidine kinase [Agrobacterium sp. SORGH_AS_0745]QTQ85876.1 sensor histidine kinase [Agrobacterium tumefaciens]
MTQVLEVRLARQGAGSHDSIFGGAALFVALTVFAVDTFTEIEGAIAVIYAISLLLAAEAVNRLGLILLTALFMVFSLASFFFTHAPDPDFPTFLRLCVALAALAVTAALLLRNENARSALLRTNAALLESEERYRSIFDRTRVALWERDYSKLLQYIMVLKSAGVTDMKAYIKDHPDALDECIGKIKVVDANDAAVELLGSFTSGEPGGVLHRIIPKDSDTFASLLQAIMDGATYFEDNAEVFNEAGERRVVLLGISFPTDPQAFNRVIVSMVDVTQREEARMALAEAQAELSRASKAAMIGALSASLAHELNQPLGAIAVNSQTLVRWLERDPPDIDAAKRSAERILRDSNRASDIFKSTRAMMLATPKESEPIELETLISDTLTLMDHDLQRDRTEVQIVRKSIVPPFKAARLEMQQVLINLISNASQAMGASTTQKRLVTIILDAPRDRDHISIAVRDSGNGLGTEAKQNLFKPFFTTKDTGMGIGLSICRSTIEARGGTLDGNNHPDGGAIFEIKLPKETADA